MDTLSPLDSAFLRLETGKTSLHIASVAIFDGPPPGYDQIASLFESRLPLLQRYRQVVREAPLRLGRPLWVDDPRFRLSNHLHHTALPGPGSREQLTNLVGRLMSTQLDRSRPLWDCWLVEGLADDRWALINRVHHCMVDGIAGTDLLSTLLAPSAPAAGPAVQPWQPRPEPGQLRLLLSAIGEVPRHPGIGLRLTLAGLRHPRVTSLDIARKAQGVLGFVKLARPAPASSMSGTLGSERSWACAHISLEDVRIVRRHLGGTVNDVVLTTVTRGFRELLINRDESPDRRVLRTLVPVSVRTEQQRGQVDNQISAVVAELPVQLHDPVARLNAVRQELNRLKVSGEAEAGAVLTEGARVIPPLVLTSVLSGFFRLPQRMVVTVATNVPGPPEPLFAVGRELRELYPYVPIADHVRIAVAICSYAGVLYFGVTADSDSTPDIDVICDGIESELNDLLLAATESPRPASSTAAR